MNNPKQPTRNEIEREINSLITIDLPDGEMYDIVESVDSFCDESYEAGYNEGKNDGVKEYEAKNPPINEEQVSAEYVVAQFSDCKTLSDFQEKFNEIRNRSYNFM